jgi:SAM-dependent methyltransferase
MSSTRLSAGSSTARQREISSDERAGRYAAIEGTALRRSLYCVPRGLEFDGAAWARKLHVDHKSIVLDLGCGEGKLLRPIAPFIARGIGIDLSSTAVDCGRQLLADLKIENVELRGEDFRKVELQPSSINAVVSMWALHHIPDAAKHLVFQRIARVLAPGGLLYVEDDTFNFNRNQFKAMVPPMYQEFEERFGKEAWAVLKRDLDGEDFECTPFLDKLLAMIGDAGLQIDSVKKLGLNGVVLQARRPQPEWAGAFQSKASPAADASGGSRIPGEAAVRIGPRVRA